MLPFTLIAGLMLQEPPPAYPPTPQQIEGRRSAYIQGTLNLAAGERATLRRREDGAYDLVQVEPIEVEAVLPPAEGASAKPNGAEPGTLRFGLQMRQDVGSLLKVENGQDQGLAYTALVVRYVGGQSHAPEATSVCTTPAGLVSFEHWPEPVIQVVIAGLRASDDPVVTCPAPVPDDAFAAEGERLGRWSTLFALCEDYYATDISVGHRLADDFEQRSGAAGWTGEQQRAAYDRGRDLERAEVGMDVNARPTSTRDARRRMRQLLTRLKPRCRYLAEQVPGAVSDVAGGDRRLQAALRQFQ